MKVNKERYCSLREGERERENKNGNVKTYTENE